MFIIVWVGERGVIVHKIRLKEDGRQTAFAPFGNVNSLRWAPSLCSHHTGVYRVGEKL